nr:hypothetical protein [Acinetobacter baumannii]
MANLNANNLPSQQVKHKQNKQNVPTQNQARTRATQENAMPIAPYSQLHYCVNQKHCGFG